MTQERGRKSGGIARYLGRTLLVAAVIAAVLIGVVLALDFFGSQPQPFQYILH